MLKRGYLLSIIISSFIFVEAQIDFQNYELVWEDQFEGDSLDMSKWSHRSLGPRRDAFNSEHCVAVQDGKLFLTTERRNDTIFSAMLSTEKKFESTYGYYEIRCLLQKEVGHWSAFWLQTPIMGKFIGDVAKAGAEIDIYEYFPNKPKQIHHTLHFDGYNEHHKVRHKIIRNRKFDPKAWHTFGLEWTPNYYTYYIDGIPQFTLKEGISMRNQYIVVSLEVGKQAGKIKKANLPDSFQVDYVKVYQTKKPLE